MPSFRYSCIGTVPPTKTVDSSRAPAPTALRWNRQPTMLSKSWLDDIIDMSASARHVDARVERDRKRCRDLQIFGDADAEHRPQHLVVVLLTPSDAAHPRLIELPAALAECRRRAAEHRPVSGGHRRLWCGEEHAGQEKSRVQHMGRIFQSSVDSRQSTVRVGSRSQSAVFGRQSSSGQSRVRPRGLHGEPSGCDDCRPPP